MLNINNIYKYYLKIIYITRMPKNQENKYNFHQYDHSVLRQVHPDTGLTAKAGNEINYLLHYVHECLIINAERLVISSHKKTLTSREIQSAIIVTLPHNIAKYSISECNKVMGKFTSNYHKGSRVSKASRAGLQFPPSRVEHLIRRHYCGRVGQDASVYLSAVLEYISAKVLELAGNEARDHHHTRITTKDIALAIKKDADLSHLFNNASLSGGELPHIHAVLVPKSKSKPKVM
jgi:histone H2A